jgi:GNAT superfamily N-acetyltransferase
MKKIYSYNDWLLENLGLTVDIVPKSKYIYDFLTYGFPEIPNYLDLDKFKSLPQILTCEAVLDDLMVGAVMFVLLDLPDKNNRTLIPVEYNLPRLHINYIYVLENFRKQKISSQMVKKIISFGESKLAGVITANVSIGNIESEQLWLSLGFTMNPVETSHPDGHKMRTFYKLIGI